MELFEAIKKRRSIRSFLPELIPQKDIEEIIEAAKWAPSGGDAQPWEFIIIMDEDAKKEIAKIVKNVVENIIKNEIKDEQEQRIMRSYGKYFSFFHKAPAIIVVYGNEDQSIFLKTVNKYRTEENKLKSSSFVQSLSAAVQNLCIAAEALGYGTCWMTGPLIAETQIKQYLKMKEDEKISAIIPIGKPRVLPSAPARKEKTIKYI